MNENSIDGVFFLSLAGLICTSTTLLIRYCYKSKCTEFKCLCFKLKRDTQTEKEEDLILNRQNSNSPKINI
jgi:hypothetical protein